MKAREEIVIDNAVIAEQAIRVKAIINQQWETFYTAEELAEDIEQGFIFGKYSNNEHYSKAWIMELIIEVENEKNPPITEDVIPEEPVIIPE
jgi:hypothetical protein